MKKDTRKYAFEWRLLGDLAAGRPTLGPSTRLEAYRLMQFSLRDVVEQHVGTHMADRLFFEAGQLAGGKFFDHLVSPVGSLEEFVSKVQGLFKELNIGLLKVEKNDVASGELVLTVSEDLDCSGLPESGDEVCVYDEGFVAALFEAFTGRRHKVKEIDCWCSGDRTCRFAVNVIPD